MNAKGLPSSQSVMKKSASTTAVFRDAATLRSAPPFIPSHDLLRGLIYAIHMTLQFAFMLIVMYVPPRFLSGRKTDLRTQDIPSGIHIIHCRRPGCRRNTIRPLRNIICASMTFEAPFVHYHDLSGTFDLDFTVML